MFKNYSDIHVSKDFTCIEYKVNKVSEFRSIRIGYEQCELKNEWVQNIFQTNQLEMFSHWEQTSIKCFSDFLC